MIKIKENFQLKKGVIYILLSALSFSIMSLFVKFVAKKTTPDKIIAFRFGISFLYILIFLLIKKISKKGISVKTNHLFLHIVRALFSTLGMIFFYTALRYLPIVDANLLFMTNALFIPVLGAIIFKTKVTYKHWIAIIIGFIGVGFILKPGNEIVGFYSFLGLFSGLSVSVSLLLVRELSQHDGPYVCMFYMFLVTFIICGSYSFLTWKPLDFNTILLLIGAGIFGTLYQDFMTKGSFHVPSRIVSALLYTTLVFTMFFDWFFINHIPNLGTWIGIILVVLSSILTIYAAKSIKIQVAKEE